MGFVGKIFKTLFNPSVPNAQAQAPTMTGRDLVSSTSSDAPEEAVMGSSLKNKKKKQGVSSLLVPSENLYKGGV